VIDETKHFFCSAADKNIHQLRGLTGRVSYDTMTLTQSELDARADQLRRLHDGFLTLPNAWDAGSARAIAALGFPAIATTNSGVSDSLGFADRQATPVDEGVRRVSFGGLTQVAAMTAARDYLREARAV
jgi:2-methylisocitrate lyase-like PEP mutase family enzyme